MNKYLKWTLWILGALLLAALIFVFGYFAFNHWNGGGWMMGSRGDEVFQGGRNFPWRNMPMHPNMMRPGRGFFGFSILRFLLGGLVRLAILGLVIYGIVALVRNLQHKAVPTTVVTTNPLEQPAAVPAESVKTCPSCGHAVQIDWTHCPYCGTALK